jgi:hypothetical protein
MQMTRIGDSLHPIESDHLRFNLTDCPDHTNVNTAAGSTDGCTLSRYYVHVQNVAVMLYCEVTE